MFFWYIKDKIRSVKMDIYIDFFNKNNVFKDMTIDDKDGLDYFLIAKDVSDNKEFIFVIKNQGEIWPIDYKFLREQSEFNLRLISEGDSDEEDDINYLENYKNFNTFILNEFYLKDLTKK